MRGEVFRTIEEHRPDAVAEVMVPNNKRLLGLFRDGRYAGATLFLDCRPYTNRMPCAPQPSDDPTKLITEAYSLAVQRLFAFFAAWGGGVEEVNVKFQRVTRLVVRVPRDAIYGFPQLRPYTTSHRRRQIVFHLVVDINNIRTKECNAQVVVSKR